jgi:hypothetical protein
MKKKIIIQMNGDQMKMDFDGYKGDACKEEEQKLRAIMGGLGVGTDDIDTKLKRAKEANPSLDGQCISG